MKITKCTHPESKIIAHWKYIGDKLAAASGYCDRCGATFVFCLDADKLVLQKEAKRPLLGELKTKRTRLV